MLWLHAVRGERAAIRGSGEQARLADLERCRRMFYTSFLLTLPVFLTAMVLPLWPAARPFLKFSIMGFPLEEIIKWAFTTPIQFWIGWRFHAGAYHALRNGRCAAASPPSGCVVSVSCVAPPLAFAFRPLALCLYQGGTGVCAQAMAVLDIAGREMNSRGGGGRLVGEKVKLFAPVMGGETNDAQTVQSADFCAYILGREVHTRNRLLTEEPDFSNF